jgi:hypothetical protein
LKSLRPPVLAAWLFEHLTQHEHRGALAGDLLEEYIRRRSDMWYWRQVVAVILTDFSTELRVPWVRVVFALIVCGTVPLNHLFHDARFRYFLSSGIKLSWPASFLAGIGVEQLANWSSLEQSHARDFAGPCSGGKFVVSREVKHL